jgi:hypothetical protein
MPSFFIKKRESMIDAVVLTLMVVFLLDYFDPRLLFLETTINGGDTGSHFPSAAHLTETLLPQGKIMGWMQGNYAGQPLFYHYFPLSFLLMAVLSCFWPLTIAFKLVTVAGTFLLPPAVYVSFRLLRYSFPTPIMAAVLSLLFLFNEGNSMWGGNIPSTLAGEFCESLGLVFVTLLIGAMHRGVLEQRYAALNAVLVFLSGIAHAFTLIFSAVVGAYFFFSNPRRNVKYLVTVYALAFLLLSFWLLPVLANLPYTTTFASRWSIHSAFEVLPVVLMPALGLSLAGFLMQWRNERTAYFAWLIMACLFIYFSGPHLGVLDIRFVPFIQLLLSVFGAVALYEGTRRLRATFLLPVIFLILAAFWIEANTSYIRHWISWNYSGYEQKKSWPVFSGINRFLAETNGGRVAWEHTPADEALGSIRTSETLPFFAGRQTLEGIHTLGALSAPFVFFLQSQTSFQPCNPLPDYFYSTFDLKNGMENFRLFNVSQFVVRSAEVKAAVKNEPAFRLEKTIGDYDIYRLTTNDGRYVTPLENKPVLVLARDWRDKSYSWFARPGPKDVFLAFAKEASAVDGRRFARIVAEMPTPEKIPYDDRNVEVRSVIQEETIEIETSKIGHPLLIKISYHPNWRVEGADRIYLVSPSFMLVFPTSHQVRLIFESGRAGFWGGVLSVLGLILAAAAHFRFKPKPAGQMEAGRGWMATMIIAAAVLGVFMIVMIVQPGSEAMLSKAHRRFDRGDYSAAGRLYRQTAEKMKMSSGARNEASFYDAFCLVRQQAFDAGAAALRRFIADYPLSFWTPQAYFELADCERRLGKPEEADRIYMRIIHDFPITPWARYAHERLQERAD